MSSILGKIGGLLIKSPMKKLKKTLDYKEYGAEKNVYTVDFGSRVP